MDFLEACKKLLPKNRALISPRNDTSGIALFMVLSAVSILAILVSEFAYIAQISQSIAFGSLDHAKAHYLAKSGFKLSLLRLKAYKNVKKALKDLGDGAGDLASPGMLQKIWNFPFFYPIPTNIPGMSNSDKDLIKKFLSESNLEGSFSSVIESETGKFNLNVLVDGYAALVAPSPNPTKSSPPTPNPTDSPPVSPVAAASSPPPTFDLTETQTTIEQFLTGILNKKFTDDSDFANNYRDFRLNDFVDVMTAWAVRNYSRKTSSGNDLIRMKEAPFYSVTELRMLPLIDDELYQFLSSSLTAGPPSGINVNTMGPSILSGIIPNLLEEESSEFFKYRDSSTSDNTFKDLDSFYQWMSKNFPRFINNDAALNTWKSDLQKKNIHLVTEESYFKITVQAQVKQSIKTIEAWVIFDDSTTDPGDPNLSHINPKYLNSGLKITFMKIY